MRDYAESLRLLAQYEDLEEQGLLVRLPCKVGDTVYMLHYDFPIIPVTVWQIENEGASWHLLGSGEGRAFINFSDIGKTVFLTREEAEAALRLSKV